MKRRPLTTHAFSTLFMVFVICTASICLVRDAEAAASARNPARRNPKNSSSEFSGNSGIPMVGETASRQEILAEVGETVYIGCPSNRTNAHGCEWYKKNPQGDTKKRITQFYDRYQRITSCYLQIRSVTYDDEGIIICKAMTDSSEPTFHTNQLTVTGHDDPFGNKLLKPGTDNSKPLLPYAEPEIAKELFAEDLLYKVHKGENTLLKCEATGNPKPLVSWRRGSRNYTAPTEGYSLLKLTNVTKDDSGVVRCEAINIFGKAVIDITIEVKGELQGASEIIDVTPRNITLYEGNRGNITCIARFEGDPWFVWVKKIENRTSEINAFTYEGQYYSVLQRTEIRPLGQHLYATTLLLQNVTVASSGVYHCIVAGLQGYNHSEAYVVVEKDPTNLHIAQIGKHKKVVILWILSFVVFGSFVIMCIFRVYGCPNAAANKALSSSQGSSPSDTSHKTQLPKRSPETLSTDCTGPRHDVLVPLVTHGSCSLASQEPSLLHIDCSSCRTYNSYDPEFSLPPTPSNSLLMTSTEVARSNYSHNNAELCDSEFCSEQSITSPRTQTSDYYTTHQLNISNYRSPRSHPRHHHKHCHQHHHLHQVPRDNHQQHQALHLYPPPPVQRPCSCTPTADYCSCHSPSYDDDYPHSRSNLCLSSDSESQWYPKSPQYHHHRHQHGEHCHSYCLDDSGRHTRATNPNARRKLNPSPNLSFLEQLRANPNTITAFL